MSQDSWSQIRLSRVVADVVDGPFGSNLTSAHYTDEGARVIRLGNIGAAQFKDDDQAFVSLEHYASLKRHAVLPGDLLIAGLGDEQNALGRACIAPPNLGPAIVKADCFRFRLRPSVDHRFAMWYLNSTAAAADIELESRGATRTRATPSAIAAVSIPMPPVEEQRRIADFLDDQVARLDKGAELRRAQIELLDKRRGAALSDCMTGFLSDQEHKILGFVSADSVPTKLVRVLRQIAVGVVVNPSSYFADEGVPFLHGYNVRDGWLDLAAYKRMLPSDSEALPRSRLLGGEVLVVRAGYPGRAAVVPSELAGANCASVLVLRCGPQLLPKYLSAFFNSPQGRGQVKVSQYGAAQEVISAGQVAEYLIPLVPINEQRRRLALLDRQIEQLTVAKGLAQRHLALLQERKQALITAAVTGQFDVTTARAVA